MKIKKNLFFSIIFIIFSLNFNISFSKSIVKVGIYDNEKLHNKQQTGFLDNYYELIEKYTDIKFKYVYKDWTSLNNDLKTGKIDLIGFVTYSPERNKYFDYSFYNIGRIYSMISTYKENEVILEKGFSVLENKKIGCIQSTVHEEKIRELLKENNISSKIIFFKDKKTMYLALKNKYLDFIIDENIRQVYSFEKILFNFSFEKTYFITKKGNNVLLNKINYALNRILIDNKNKIQNLEFKLNKEEENFLKTLPILNVGFIKENGYLSRKNNNSSKGIELDLINIISKNLNIRINLVPIDSISQAEKMMKNLELDIFVGITYEDNYNKDFYYSIPYYNSRYYIIKNKDYLNSTKFKAGILEDILPLFSNVLKDHSFEKISTYNNVEKLLKKINNNIINFTLLETDVADYYLRNNLYKNLNIELSPYKHLKSFAISKNLPFYFSTIVNKTICNLDENTINEIILKNKIYNDDIDIFNKINITKTQLIFLYGLIVILSIIILVLFYFNHKSKKRFNHFKKFDKITECYNFDIFKKNVTPLLANIRNKKYAFLYVELLNLNYITETCGYKIKHKILKLVNTTVLSSLNNSEYFCRIDFNNFVGLIKYTNHKLINERFYVIDSKIKKELNSALNEFNINLTIKTGIFIIDKSTTLEKALFNSFYAKKFNKENIYSSIGFYKNCFRENFLLEENLKESLKTAIQNKEIEILYYPIYNFKNKLISGAEITITWNHPQLGKLSKEKFLPLISNSNFMNEFIIYVLKDICSKLEFFNIKNINTSTFSFNLPIDPFENNFYRKLTDVVKYYNFNYHLINFKLPNLNSNISFDKLLSNVSKIKNLGFKTYSYLFENNFSIIKNINYLNIDFIIIDLSNIKNNDLNSPFTKDLFNFFNLNNIDVILTNINTEKDLEYIKHLNFKYVQGNLFSEPIKFDKFYKLSKYNSFNDKIM